MKVKSLGIELSKAYFGCMEKDHIRPIHSCDENERVFLVCVAKRQEIYQLSKTKFNRSKDGDLQIIPNKLFEFFEGYVNNKRNNHKVFSGKTFWEVLSANAIGNDDIWCISDGEDDRVYLMHSWKDTLYHLGRVYKGHPLEKACHWRYKRIKF